MQQLVTAKRTRRHRITHRALHFALRCNAPFFKNLRNCMLNVSSFINLPYF